MLVLDMEFHGGAIFVDNTFPSVLPFASNDFKLIM
jgi:hypothetical protein